MNIRFSQAVAGLAVVAIAVWLWMGPPAGSGADAAPGDPAPPSGGPTASTVEADTSLFTNRNEGSALPCAFPLRWRVARVDARFALSRSEVEAAIGAAGGLWEEAVGRRLFSPDSEEGFPVRLVYDERQARSRDLRAGEAELDEAGAAIEARSDEIARLERDLREAQRRYRARAEEFETRMSAHNDSVRMWNARGGAPEAVASRLDAAGESLRGERAELQARREVLDRRGAELDDGVEALQDRIRAWEQEAGDLERSVPSRPVQSGIYREAVRMEDGRVTSVDREIRVYRFEDENDLRRVLAHELGHAMGLGHVDASRALMNAEYARADRREMGPTLSTPDLNALRSRCSDL